MACDAPQGADNQLRTTGRLAGGHETPEGKEKTMSKLILKTEGDKHVVVTRRLAAPLEAVYRAHTEPDGAGTLLTMRMTLPDVETRTRMLSSGMEHGMEASYLRLERML
ncbi:MAG TPA: SRPBCC domain-containing protein [Steroidobacteraceae bacterium]